MSPSQEISGTLRDLSLSQQPSRNRSTSINASQSGSISRTASAPRTRQPLQALSSNVGSTPFLAKNANSGSVIQRSPKRLESPNAGNAPAGKKPRARQFLDELDSMPTPNKQRGMVYEDAPPLPPVPASLSLTMAELPAPPALPPLVEKENEGTPAPEKKKTHNRRRSSMLQTMWTVFKAPSTASEVTTGLLKEQLQVDADIAIDKQRKNGPESKTNYPVSGVPRKVFRWILLNPECDDMQLAERFLLAMPDFAFLPTAAHKELRDTYLEAKAVGAEEQRSVALLVVSLYEKWASLLSGNFLTQTLLGAVPLIDDLFSDSMHDLGSRILALSRTHNTTPRPLLLGVGRQANLSVLNVLSFSSADAAKALTACDRELLMQVSSEEWLSCGWTKPHFQQLCPFLFHVVDRFNRISPWINSELAVAPEDKRGKVISKLVRIASACMEMGNYNALMAIVAALNQGVVNNQFGWRKLSSKRTKQWERLEARMDMSGNFQNYRTAARRNAPIMPYIGLYCKDLAVMGEVLPTFIDGNLNTAKVVFVGGILLALRTAQTAPNPTAPTLEAAQYFSALPVINPDTAHAVLERSRK